MKSGDENAAQQLWELYLHRLIELADRVLGDTPRGVADEEDVAVEALRHLIESARKGAFPQLHDRNDLWQVLVMLTTRKAIEQRRRETAEKRGGGGLLDEQHLDGVANQSIQEILADHEPTPEFTLQFREELAKRMDRLEDPLFQKIVFDKLSAFTNREIAQRHKISLRAVERKLQIIRRRWFESPEVE